MYKYALLMPKTRNESVQKRRDDSGQLDAPYERCLRRDKDEISSNVNLLPEITWDGSALHTYDAMHLGIINQRCLSTSHLPKVFKSSHPRAHQKDLQNHYGIEISKDSLLITGFLGDQQALRFTSALY